MTLESLRIELIFSLKITKKLQTFTTQSEYIIRNLSIYHTWYATIQSDQSNAAHYTKKELLNRVDKITV